MKPISKKDSFLQRNFRYPHDIWYNGNKGRRIARRRWKQARSKHLRQMGKNEIDSQIESFKEYQTILSRCSSR